MYPVIFEYNGFVISSFGLMLVIAFYACNMILRNIVEQNGYAKQIADDIIFRAAIGGIIGAKVYYILENISSGYGYSNIEGLFNIFKGIFSLDAGLLSLGIQSFGSGMVFLGGLIGGTASVSLYVKKHNMKWVNVADWVAPLIALGHGIGRIGCLLVGDDYGKPTSLPWGIKFENGLPVSNAFNLRSLGVDIPASIADSTVLAVHPTQIYEMLIYFTIFAYLFRLNRTRFHKFEGQLMYEYLFLAGLGRFLVEFIRLNPSYIFGLSGAQLISMAMMIVGSTMFYRNLRK